MCIYRLLLQTDSSLMYPSTSLCPISNNGRAPGSGSERSQVKQRQRGRQPGSGLARGSLPGLVQPPLMIAENSDIELRQLQHETQSSSYGRRAAKATATSAEKVTWSRGRGDDHGGHQVFVSARERGSMGLGSHALAKVTSGRSREGPAKVFFAGEVSSCSAGCGTLRAWPAGLLALF